MSSNFSSTNFVVNSFGGWWLFYVAQFIKHFGKYGEITDSVIMKDRKTGQPRGFGFVTYADPSVVDKVIEDTHIINGKQVGWTSLLVLCLSEVRLASFSGS